MQQIAAALTLSAASFGLSACNAGAKNPEPTPINEADPQIKQWREKGYVDLGEGVFVIPQSKGRNVMGDIAFGKALKNWRIDHPQLEITYKFEIDGDSSAGQSESSSLHNRDGLVLWTQTKGVEK